MTSAWRLLYLLKKNIACNNSALEPIRVFSTASTSEQLLVRIDDKLNRLKNGVEYQDEDAIDDLIGYLILLKVQYIKRVRYLTKRLDSLDFMRFPGTVV